MLLSGAPVNSHMNLKISLVTNDDAPQCGRPLGLAFDTLKPENLIVMDSSTGIFELNVNTKKLKIVILVNDEVGKEVRASICVLKKKMHFNSNLFSSLLAQNPRRSKLINSVAVAKNGDIYYTESTSDVEIDKVFLSMFLNPSGRLMHFERKTKKVTVLVDRLFFGNGIVISPNEEFLVVSDLGRNKLIEYWIATKRIDTVGVFANNLPGCPDNIVADDKGIWVALPIASDPDNLAFFQRLTEYPTIRKFIARTLYLLEAFLKNCYKYTSLDYFKTLIFKINSYETYSFMLPKRASVLRFDWKGKLIASYHTYDGNSYTHAMELNGKLYLGSFSYDFIARVDRRDHE